MSELYSRGATFSDCGLYRYQLWRIWDPDGDNVLFIGLNPSTADGEKEDNTTRRLNHFARTFGFGGFSLVNLFAYRATTPPALLTTEDPIGQLNDRYIEEELLQAVVVVPCWGQGGSLHDRGDKVLEIIDYHLGELPQPDPDLHPAADPRPLQVKCFGFTKHGHPKHPLYLPNNTELIDYPLEEDES